MRSFWLIHSTRLSGEIPKFNGSATLSTSTEKCVVSHQLENHQEVLEKDIHLPRPLVVHVVLPGSATTPSKFTGNVNNLFQFNFFFFLSFIFFSFSKKKTKKHFFGLWSAFSTMQRVLGLWISKWLNKERSSDLLCLIYLTSLLYSISTLVGKNFTQTLLLHTSLFS